MLEKILDLAISLNIASFFLVHYSVAIPFLCTGVYLAVKNLFSNFHSLELLESAKGSITKKLL